MSNIKKLSYYMESFMRARLGAFVALGLLAPMLSGCWHVPPEAIWRLRKVDMLQLDPGSLRLAARTPDWLEAQPGSAMAKLFLQSGEGPEQEIDARLQEGATVAELRDLARGRAPGTHFLVFRIAAADAARLRAVQASARQAKAQNPGRSGGIRIKLEAKGCRRGDPPAGPAIADLYLSLGEGEAFFKVYQELDLSEMHGEGATFRDETPLCGKLAQKAL
jgi:hypothetical protein